MGKASRAKQTKQKPIITQERNWFPWIITGISILVVVALVIVVVVTNNLTKPGEQSTVAPQGVVNDGYVITKDGLDTTAEAQPVKTDFEATSYSSDKNSLALYIDYSCTHCADFEENNFAQVEQWLQDGTLDSISIHPLAFLGQYSLDAGNAFACVAENNPEQLLEAHKTLMANWDQGLKKTQILNVLQEAGIKTDNNLEKCVRNSTYNDFVTQATERGANGPIPASNIENIAGTPTILLNGTKYPGDPASAESFSAYVTQNVKGSDVPVETTDTESN